MKLIIWLACVLGIECGLPGSVPVYKLLSGKKMPAIGFGTLLTPKQVDEALMCALESGYRHIDTAYMFENEENIGNTLEKWFAEGNRREDLFITAKLPPQAMRSSDVEKALEISLNNLGLNYVDMYLINLPVGMERTKNFGIRQDDIGNPVIDFSTNHLAIWRALEKQVKIGRVKSIGLSNFNKAQLLRLWKFARIKPSNLQVETNAYLQQEELLELCQKLGIVLTGYSPLGSDGLNATEGKQEIDVLPPLIKHPVVTKIATDHNKSTAQVLLRFGLQRGMAVIPKSTDPKRMKENIDILDFVLTAEEMNELKGLDHHGKYRKFDYLEFTGIECHPGYPFSYKIPMHCDIDKDM